MATYYVTVNRPTIDAATPEEAAHKALSDPMEVDDQVFVKELDPAGSLYFVPGAAATLGGSVPTPDEVYKGPDFTPMLRRK